MTRAEITLDVATMEGKTWLARITGLDKKFGLQREFVPAAARRLSKSGKTGSIEYLVEPGLYESNEGRRRLGRRYWRVDMEGSVSPIDISDVMSNFDGKDQK